MLIRRCWNSIVSLCKTLRPPRRRRRTSSAFGESFEPRRMLSAFFVNSLADSYDAQPGDGIAADANGQTTLRAAIEEANAWPGADIIHLPSGNFAAGQGSGSPLVVSDELQIVGEENGSTVIDGSAADQVFQIVGSGRLNLIDVIVTSSRDVAASQRAPFLTTNARQADLIVAFAPDRTPLIFETTSTSNGLSAVVAAPQAESVFDPGPEVAASASAGANSRDSAVDEIINALFRTDPVDLILPTSGERESPKLTDDKSPQPLPMSNNSRDKEIEESDDAPDCSVEPPNDFMSIFNFDDGDFSAVEPFDETTRTVLRGWADEAGLLAESKWSTATSTSVPAKPSAGRRLSTLATLFLCGVATQNWTHSSGWRNRFAQLRRKPR